MAPNLNRVSNIVRGARPNWPRLTKYIGGGANGRVFETNNGRYLKIITTNSPREWQALAKLQGSFLFPRFTKGNHVTVPVNSAQKTDFARILNVNAGMIKSALTMFIMGRVGNGEAMTLHKYLTTFPDINLAKVQSRVFDLIEAMHSRGVSHGDLHSENILIRPDAQGRILGMWAIDFGRSRNIPIGMTERELYATIKSNYNFWTPKASNRPAIKVIEYDKYRKYFPRADMRRVNREAMTLIRSLPDENLKTSKIYLICTDRGLVTGVQIVRGGKIRIANGSRANVNMSKVHYSKNFIAPRENIIRERRMWVANVMKNYKSPGKVSSVRKTRSAERASPSLKRKRDNSNNNADRKRRRS